jgi:hypothetical protein
MKFLSGAAAFREGTFMLRSSIGWSPLAAHQACCGRRNIFEAWFLRFGFEGLVLRSWFFEALM